jgi:hypothetical protein
MHKLVRGMTRLALLAALPLALGAVAPGSTSAQEPEAAAEAWLALMDADDFVASWNEAAELFQGATTADEWAAQGAAVREQLGSVVSREIAEVQQLTDPPGAPEGEYYNIRYNSEYSSMGAAMEVVALVHEADRGWRVVGYVVQPPAGE